MKFLVPTLFALTVLGATSVAQDVPETATDSFWRNDGLIKSLTSIKSHTLANVRKSPEAYRGLAIRMEIQFNEFRKNWNPYFTRFTHDNYASFAAWSGEQALWKRDEYTNDFGFFFVSRNSAVTRKVMECKKYDRVNVEVIVRDVFRGIPYIEVMKLDTVDDSLTEATIIAGAKAEKAAEEGDTATALAEFERAMRGHMPKILRAQLYCDIAKVYVQRGDRQAALDKLDKAKSLQPDNAEFAKAIDKVSKEPLPAPRAPKRYVGEPLASRPAIERPVNAAATKKPKETEGAGVDGGR